MYLLNRSGHCFDASGMPFTFHYVSIKSTYLSVSNGDDIYLHSTMYLLNRCYTAMAKSNQQIYIPLCIY